MTTTSIHPYTTLAEVEALVERFERGALPLSEWNHATRLTVGLWHMMHCPEHVAAARMIGGIRALNRAYGIRQSSDGGYNETVTLFWLVMTRRFLDGVTPRATTLELVNAFLVEFAPRQTLVFEYFSRARLQSWKARHTWIEPDLRSLDGP